MTIHLVEVLGDIVDVSVEDQLFKVSSVAWLSAAASSTVSVPCGGGGRTQQLLRVL